MVGGNSDEPSGPARPPTLKTIAFMTGLSVTAVSRALKDAPDISAETKEKVRLVAKQIGYRPSRAGVRLRTGRTQVISLILNTDEEIMGFTSQLVNGISFGLRDSSYHLVVTPYSHSDDPLDPVRYVAETNSADGILLSRIEPRDRRIAYLHEKGIPFATHGRTNMGIEHPWSDFDNERFAYEGAVNMARKGASRIALLPPSTTMSYGLHTHSGFNRGIREAGATGMLVSTTTVDDTLDCIHESVLDLVTSQNRPDALIISSAGATIAATAAIEKAGLVVGKDIRVLSKQPTPILNWIRQGVDVIHEDVRAAGIDLADFVIRAIQGEDPKSLQRLSYAKEVPAAARRAAAE